MQLCIWIMRMTTNFTSEKRRDVRSISMNRHLNFGHDGMRKTLRIIHHCLKYSTGALKLLNGTFQHFAIGTQVREEERRILRAVFDIAEQQCGGAYSSVGSGKLCGAVAGQWRQPQQFYRSPLINFCQQAVSVLRENKKVIHALLRQKLRTIGISKALECETCVGFIVDMLKIHSGGSQARNCRCIISPPAIFTRREPDSACESANGADCSYPISPLRYAKLAILLCGRITPRNPLRQGKSGKDHEQYCQADCSKNSVFFHSFSIINWQNRNTQRIGGGK